MKNRILTFVLLLSGLFLLGGCYDSIEQRISLLKERVSELEDRANKLNESINNLSGLITALEKNDHIVSISDWSSGSKKGYRISFTSGSSLIINSGTNGVVPIVGVQFNEQYGAYYWTIQMGPDGSPTWMTNSYGQRVRASGTVPQLKIEDGIWWYSFDGGRTWNKTGWGAAQGENGTSVFSSIDTSDPYFVIFTLVDKSVIKLPTQKGIDDITNSCGLANEIIEMYMSQLLHTDSSRFVKNVVAIENENQTTGYRITFDDDSDITIFNGRNDRDSVWIGIQTYTDGKRYFVYRAHAGDYVDWMRYQGQMICADIEDVTPHIGITDSLGVLYFTVAYGEGEPELMLNAEGNPVQATGTVVLDFFTDIDLSNPNTVVLIMEDGTRIALPRTRIYTPSLTLIAADIDVAAGLEYPNQLVAVLTDTLTSRTVCPDFDAFCELTGSHLEAVATDGGLVNTLRVASFVGRQISEGIAYTAHVTIPFTTASRADWDVTRKTRIAVFYSWGTSSIMKVAEFDQIILVDEVRLDETEITVNKGETRSLMATVLPEDASDKTVTWTSSDERIATVSQEGVVTAVAAGTCVITATAGKESVTCDVTVVIPAASVILDKSEYEIWINQTFTLKATVMPLDATDKTVTWSSSDESVATVSQEGVVTTVGAGTCTITASSGGKEAVCNVTVRIPVSGVILDRSECTLCIDSTLTLKATVLPEDASDKTVSWSSSNTAIATVSQDGIVTAVGSGTCTITAESSGKTATCQVTVFIPAASVILNRSECDIWLFNTFTLQATVLPLNTTDKTVTWSSSDESVATVSQEGVVTAVGGGTCTITATSGGKSATCRITVKIPVERVVLDITEATMFVDSTVTLKATVLPENATDKTVSWLSSDTSVATVSQNGVVTATGEGRCIIRASSGGKSATCMITVKVPVSGITLDKDVLEMIVMQTTSLTATVLPANADDKTVTWSTSDPMVARVTPQGVITAVAPGTCIITATASGYSASCQVTVTMPVSSVTLDKEAITIYIGESTKLTATVLPENASDKTVTWTSSNELIADLSNDGTVHALAAGTCTITATAGGKSATCQVTVLTPVSRVTVAPASCQVFIDSTVTLVATVFPADAHDKTVTWSSSDETIATVTQGGVVSTHALGNCTITASAGGKSATCQVTVIPRVVITGITLEPKELEVYVGEVHNLNATITPEDATDKTIVWTTSDDAVVTVNAQGVVTPTGEGSGYVVASTVNGLTDTAYFTVLKAPVFPDAAFRTYVYDNFDTNHDGVLSRSEAKVVTTIQANGLGIQSLEGIEYFDALNALYCYNNQITSLTLTPTITYVVCFGNKIAKMDLTSATGLTYLECSDNKLDSLDVSSNPALLRLICDGNQMKMLDISNNPSLISLMCQNNLLTSLDLSHAQNLQTLQCNGNRLATLNISRNRQMTNLNCLENPMTTLYMAIGQTVSRLRKPSDTTIEYIEVPDDPEPDPEPDPDPNPDLPDPDDPNT
ncbi:MAG: Ig-like domain-containing protein [Bacteroidales bacterium]